MISVKVTSVGTSAGVILTKEALAALRVEKGDSLFLTEAPGGGFRLTPYNPDFERQMQLAETVMHEDREVLRTLAK
jgi:putative addiction module antidote